MFALLFDWYLTQQHEYRRYLTYWETGEDRCPCEGSIPSSPTNLNSIIMHVRITNMKIYRREKVEQVSVDDGWVRIAHAGRVTNISPIDNQDLHKEFGFKIY